MIFVLCGYCYRYLNIHTMLLLQQITDQDNVIIADQLLFAPKFSSPLFGSIFTPTLVGFLILIHSSRSITSCLPGNRFLPKLPKCSTSSTFIVVPACILCISLSIRSVIDGALYCLRDRASPLMYFRVG